MQSVFHVSPYPLKVLMASVKGKSIFSWRYGNNLEQLVAEAVERESWRQERWRSWQEERLAMRLERAVRQVPYYRDYWQKRRAAGDRSSWQLLENWPVLEKDVLRKFPMAFLADDCSPRRMQHWQTSGSSGTPIHIWWSRETMRYWYALFEARWRRWYDVDVGDRWAILGGKMVVPVRQKRAPFWVWNHPMKQLYMSAYHISQENCPAYISALRKYNVSYIHGYSSALYALALGAMESGERLPPLRVAITNAEPLWAHQRELIEKVFGCPVRETYGMAESVVAAGECNEGRLHSWPEAGVLEFLHGETSVAPGEAGDIVSSGLVNPDMPLIRYRVGDRSLRPEDRACRCGRQLPVFPGIEGRCDDVVITRDGRHVGRLDPVFKASLAIRAAQIIQEDFDRFVIKVIPTQNFSDVDSREIIKRLQERVGDAEVSIEVVASIPLGPNGKFKAVVSKVS